uniref:non-specific serine/threonine protein kinase n=1 Tax=Magallana gigas TaxID=29159 RepID=K1PB18_MAGGI
MKKGKGKKKSGGPPPPPPPPMMESNMASNSNFEQDLNVMEAPRAKKVGFKNVQTALWKESLGSQSRISHLNLSGVEQLTDMFFAVAESRNIKLPHMTSINLNGCSNITDFSVLLIAKNFQQVSGITMKGCTEITERSIHYITDGSLNLQDCQMTSSKVRAIPLKIEKSLGLFNFKSCPLISPSTEMYSTSPNTFMQKFSGTQMDKEGTAMLYLDNYKVVILNESGKPSIGERITSSASPGKGMKTWLEWKPIEDVSVTVNLIEISELSFEGLVLSNGGVVIIPFSDKTPSYIQKMANTILIKDKWRLNEFRFHDQLVFTAGKKLVHYLKKIIAREPKSKDSPELLASLILDKEEQCFSAISNVIQAVQDHYPWHVFHYFAPVKKLFQTPLLTKQKQLDIFKGNFGYLKTLITTLETPTLSNLNMKDPYKEMIQVLGLRFERGMSVFFPDISGNPCMASFSELEYLLTGMMENPPDKKGFIKGLGISVPCYRRDDIKVIFGQSMKTKVTFKGIQLSERVDLFIEILESAGCLLNFPCDLRGPGFEDSIAYVLFTDIPSHPPVPLENYWPEQLPKRQLQAQKFYRFAALPPDFMSTLLGEFSNLLQFTLLWKGGFLCQQGPVVHLLEVLETPGVCTISVSSRAVNPPSDHYAGKNPELEGMLWNGFKQVCSIFDAHIQKFKIYVLRYYPCLHCLPGGSRYQATNPEKVCQFSEMKILAGHDRGLSCKKAEDISQEELVVKLKDYFGPDFQRKDQRCLPNHSCFDAEYEKMIEDTVSRQSNQTRCYMCGNCARESHKCWANVEDGLTIRHCGCLLPCFLCKYCGICRFCVQKLAKAHSMIHPQFQCESLMSSTYDSDLSQNGNFIFMSSSSEYRFAQPMTVEYFTHLRACLHRGHFHLKLTSSSHEILVNCVEKTIKVVTKTFMKEKEEVLIVLTPYTNGDIFDIWFDFDKNDMSTQFLRIQQNQKTVLALTIPDKYMSVTILCKRPGSVTSSSNHLIKMPKISTTAHGFTGSATVSLLIINGSALYDEEMRNDLLSGVKDDDLKPFCQVKLDSEVVFKTKISKSSRPRFDEKVEIQINDPESVLEIEAYEYDHVESILLGVVMLPVTQLIDLSNQLDSKFHHLNGTRNGKIHLKVDVQFNDKDNEEHLKKKFSNKRGDMFIPKNFFDGFAKVGNKGNGSLSYVALSEDRQCKIPSSMLLQIGEDDRWDWHLMNAPGFELQEDFILKIVFTWVVQCVLLSSRVKLSLPDCKLLFPALANEDDIDAKMVQNCVYSLLNFSTVYMNIIRGLDFSVNFYVMGKKNHMKNLKSVHRMVVKKIDQTGFDIVPSFYNSKHHLLLCPGHNNAYVRTRGISKISMSGFETYNMFIQNLVLTKNNLTSLPDALFSSLKQLKIVDLSENILESIPGTIGQCGQMEILRIQDNNLADLPMELAQCANLQVLNISRNLMNELPVVVPLCTSLEQLYMNDMFMTELPEEIDLSLRGVIWFVSSPSYIMSRDRFTELLEVHGLRRWLDAHNEDKEELFKAFDEDGNGILDQNEIGRLNATIYNIFPRFGYKGKELPDENTESGFPMQILQLLNLRYLNLSYQGLVHIPESISLLSSLQHLVVSYNPHLLNIAAEAGSLPLMSLEMAECPILKTPPKEIRSQGFTASYGYLRRLLSGSVECKRTKLMLVGLGEAGKTSLARALQSDDLKSSLTGHESITDGIDICTWKTSRDGEEISYSIWDFAGQTVYYNTHHFFLSNRAVYFLVWNVRLGHEHAGLKFWLSSISVHAPKAPVLIVGTHIDQVSKVELPMEELKASFSQIEGFYFVSSLTGQGLDDLKNNLITVTLTQGYMGESIPMAWLELEEIIKKLKTKTKMDTIEYSQLFKRAGVAGIVNEKEFAEAVAFLHDLGSLQHFSGNEYLHSKVVVNPQWIVDVMACVVSVKESPIKNGRLKHEDAKKVWKDYPESLHQWLLRLTEEFDLTFCIPQEEGSKERVNLVPCLLPESKPKFEWPEPDKKNGVTETKMVYMFDYLPAGLFNRGQVRLQEYSDYYIIWKKGSFLKKDGQIALLQQTKDTQMVVNVQGKNPEIVLFHIHEVFESLILEAYQGVKYDFTIPCPDCLKHSAKDPHMFLSSTIRRAIELKAPFLQCMAYFHTISVVDLQSIMPPTSNNDFDVHIQKAVSGLQDLRRNMKIELMAPGSGVQSLSWFPEESNQYSTDLMARALMDSTIFVVFISTSYANDRSCTDIFKYAKLTLGKPMVVIVVGEDNFSWRKTNLGLLLPDVSFVNMINSKKDNYNSKFQELLGKLDELMNLSVKAKDAESPECFISYCWKNSAQAVALGTRPSATSLGFGDPREIKSFLEKNSIGCWIDVERIGMNGLFDEIARGLLECKVVVACVSDDYVESPSCCKEFRYACTVLNLPLVICVVGTGHKWRRSEVAMLTMNSPVVSFQLESEEAFTKLLQLVEEALESSKQVKNEKTDTKEGTSDKERANQFKELYELAQRKFLRQIRNYASSQEVAPYPRLFVADIVPLEENPQSFDKSMSIEEKLDDKEENQIEKGEMEVMNSGYTSRRFCIHILCECDKGWHSVTEPMMLPEDFGREDLTKHAPYLSRITAIMKHSKNFILNCLTDEDGQNYMKWLFESAEAVLPDFMKEYHDLRYLVMEMDSQKLYGQLSRCRLSSGKVIWLCDEHAKEMKVTVLAKDAVSLQKKAASTEQPEFIAKWLREINAEKLAKKFNSAEKVKKNFNQELVDKAMLQASFAKEDTENYNSDIQQQIMADLKKGLAPSQVKGQEKRTVLRHGSAVKKQEVQKSEAAIQRHATTSLVSPPRSITSPPTSGQSTPKLKRPTSQACSVM